MAYGKSSTGIGPVFLKACDRRNHAEASGFQHSKRGLELRLSLWRRLIACGLSLYILVESAKSEVGQTIALCRLLPRPRKAMSPPGVLDPRAAFRPGTIIASRYDICRALSRLRC